MKSNIKFLRKLFENENSSLTVNFIINDINEDGEIIIYLNSSAFNIQRRKSTVGINFDKEKYLVYIFGNNGVP